MPPGLISGNDTGFSDELINVFDTAVAKAPGHYPLYEVAIHFPAEQWSGTAEARKHIIEVAEKNNPDANWTKAMRQYHATDFNDTPDPTVNAEASGEPGQPLNRPEMWLIGSVMAVLALWIGFVWVRKPAVKNY